MPEYPMTFHPKNINMKKITTALLLCMALNAYSATGNPSLPSAPDGEVAGHGYVDL